MTIKELLDKIKCYGCEGDQETEIRNAITKIYTAPPPDPDNPADNPARALFDAWFADNTNTIIINVVRGGGSSAVPYSGEMKLDINRIGSFKYIDNSGIAVAHTYETQIVHELVHALLGKVDNCVGGVSFDGDRTEYKGDTVKHANKIFKQLGLPELNSYAAQHKDLIEGYDYAPGVDKIDCADTGDGDFNTREAGNSNDLLIGDKDGRVMLSGAGNDYLYGMGGDDDLFGEEGDDHLHGGAGENNLFGGTGNDKITDEDEGGVKRGAVYYGYDQSNKLIGGSCEDTEANSGPIVTYKSKNGPYEYVHHSSDPKKAGTLYITVGGAVIGQIDNFKSGDLDIYLTKEKKKVDLNPARVMASPLVLDLDGDGIETIGVDQSRALFDLDGDGIKQRTGWVGSDDGLLVFDRNGDGIINDGRELFGDATLKYNGSGTFTNGFSALSQEDTNGDGYVNAQDQNWSSLQVWRDLNQNGLTDAGELFSLEQLGIVSFDLGYQIHGQKMQQNGNYYYGHDQYTTEDGGKHMMTDVFFAQDNFYKDDLDESEIAQSIKDSIPYMAGTSPCS